MIINIPENRYSSMLGVKKWLTANKNIEILNYEEVFQSLSLIISNQDSTVVSQKIIGIINNINTPNLNFIFQNGKKSLIQESILFEQEIFLKAIFFFVTKNKYFGNYKNNFIENKIIYLKLAAQCGLKIPSTIITGDKKTVENFYNLHKKGIITKSLGGSIRFESENDIYWGSGTTLVSKADFEEIPDYFLPTLFQEKIEKEYEIRAYLFNEKFYSMAILSQKDDKTSLDFRNYNRENPNRMVPYKLPDQIEKNLLKFAKITDLETGSFDLIVTKKEKEFIFLEVNPYGQFGWLSKNCNYYLEKQIAEYFEN